MSTPVLHVLAGPNGSGKSTFVARVLQPVTHLPFVNADEIAAERWPGEELEHAYQASRAAADQRRQRLARGESFITETVFSHHSKVALVTQAVALGYLVNLHVMLVPADLAVARVAERVLAGDGSYDALGEREQAIVRADWDEQVADRIAALDFETEFAEAGETWSEADDAGQLIARG